MSDFERSYLGRLRKLIGRRLVLMPGARIVCENAAGEVLLIRRGDLGTWSMPAGSAEAGQSIEQTARQELFEETGLIAGRLVPFGHASDPALELMAYPNGDRLHAFALMFHCTAWAGDARPDGQESVELAWARPEALPARRMSQLDRTLAALARFKAGDGFQLI